MNQQTYDFFGDVFARYFKPAVAIYPRVGRTLVHRLLTSTVDFAVLHDGEVGAVYRRCCHDLEAAHPMDAALRRILDEYETLRVDLPA